MKQMRLMTLATLAFAALAVASTASLSSSRQRHESPFDHAGAAALQSPAVVVDRPVLVRILRGLKSRSDQEVSITTMFRSPTFSVMADAEVAASSEAELLAHIREIFSLEEIASVGSSIVALPGGSAVLDDNGRQLEIRIQGERLGSRAVRLMVSQSWGGRQVVATSVIARAGKTIVLVGPATPGSQAGHEIDFVCLTPLD